MSGENNEVSKVNIVSSDNVSFKVDSDIAYMSKTVKDHFTAGDVDTEEPFPLMRVSSQVYTKILEWCKHHRNDPEISVDEDERRKTTEIPEWDQKFCQVDQEMLFEIIVAANYLNIGLLLDIGCKTVANLIKGKQPEEIRKMFNIQNDFNEEEEQEIRRENEWAEDR